MDRKQLEKERLERLAKRKLDNEIYDNKRLKTENPSISNNIISNLKSFSETPLKNDQLKTGSFNIKGGTYILLSISTSIAFALIQFKNNSYHIH